MKAKRILAIVAIAVLFLFAPVPAKAGVIPFGIRPFLGGTPASTISFTQTIDLTVIGGGVATTVPQFPDPDGAGPLLGSDTASIFGTILGDWDPGAGTFELVSGGQYSMRVNATPGNGGVPGAYSPFDPVVVDPGGPPGGTTFGANFGVTAATTDTGLALAFFEVLHGQHGDWATLAPGPRPWNPVTGAFSYVPGADFLLSAGGRLAFTSSLGADTTSTVGDPNAVLGTAGLAGPTWDPTDTTAGFQGTLTIPIESSFSIDLDLSSISPGAVGTVIFTAFGVIIATPIAEPSSIVLLGFGAVGLLIYGWRRRKRRV